MEAELAEIRDFLAAQPPFDRLPAEVLDRLPKSLSIRYLRRGSAFPPADTGEPFLYVIRTGAVEFRDDRARLLEKYAEGEIYSAPCMEETSERRMEGTVVEDSLCYLLPCERLSRLREAHPAFSEHFSRSVAKRLRSALKRLQATNGSESALMTVSVGELATRAPVWTSPDTPIAEAARLMSEEQVSSLLIMDEQVLVGIVTDRDLRSRCLAAGLAPASPVERVMSAQLHKIGRETPAYEAMLTMARLGIHHLPVLDSGRLTGVVSLTDLMRFQSASAAYVAGSIRKSESVETLRQNCAELPRLQAQLVASGVSAFHLGQTISSVTDALTVRLLELAEDRLGPAPVPYAWMAVGSQARREQTVHSDQDHALILSDDYAPEAHEKYFTGLARFVSNGLKECGFKYCPGEVMATNPQWRQPRSGWRRYFNGWITRPERKAMMLAANFFDMRVIHGEPALWSTLHAEVLKTARENTTFIAHMAANAVRHRPPLGFFRNFVLIHGGEHADTLDIKLRGIMPAAELARVYALSAGLPEINTCERLRAAAQVHAVSKEGAANLQDSFELMTTLRAVHQAGQIRSGRAPDNYLSPTELSALERAHLKDAFSVLNTMQRALAQRYQSERFA